MSIKKLVVLAGLFSFAGAAQASSEPETVECKGFIVSESGVLTGDYKLSVVQNLEAPNAAKAELEYVPGQFSVGLEMNCTRPQILPILPAPTTVTHWVCEAEAWTEGSIIISVKGGEDERVAEATIDYTQPDLTTVPVGKIDCARTPAE